jgi:hypothetical protein
LENRIRQSDFVLLEPQIQQYYKQSLQVFKEMSAQEKLEIQRAQSGFIPTTGPLVRTDLKTEVPSASGGMKTVSKSFPIDALAWLEKQMGVQGASVESLMKLDQQSQAGVASEINRMNPQPQAANSQPQNLTSLWGSREQQQAALRPQGVMNGIGSTNQFNRNPNR